MTDETFERKWTGRKPGQKYSNKLLPPLFITKSGKPSKWDRSQMTTEQVMEMVPKNTLRGYIEKANELAALEDPEYEAYMKKQEELAAETKRLAKNAAAKKMQRKKKKERDREAAETAAAETAAAAATSAKKGSVDRAEQLLSTMQLVVEDSKIKNDTSAKQGTQIEAQGTQIEAQGKQIEAQGKQIMAVNGRVGNLEVTTDRLRDDVDANKDQTDILRSSVKNTDNRMDNLESNNDVLMRSLKKVGAKVKVFFSPDTQKILDDAAKNSNAAATSSPAPFADGERNESNDDNYITDGEEDDDAPPSPRNLGFGAVASVEDEMEEDEKDQEVEEQGGGEEEGGDDKGKKTGWSFW